MIEKTEHGTGIDGVSRSRDRVLVGATIAGKIGNDQPVTAAQRLNVAAVIAPTAGAGPAAVKQDQGSAGADIEIMDRLAADLDKSTFLSVGGAISLSGAGRQDSCPQTLMASYLRISHSPSI